MYSSKGCTLIAETSWVIWSKEFIIGTNCYGSCGKSLWKSELGSASAPEVPGGHHGSSQEDKLDVTPKRIKDKLESVPVSY